MRCYPKVILRRITVFFGLTTLLGFSGCVMIPFETPEARNQIQHDLRLAPDEIQAISETNWCFYQYGSDVACTVTQGLGVLTDSGLTLSLYKNKTYTEVIRISSDQVACAKTVGGRDAGEPFVVFIQDKGILVTPVTPRGTINTPVKVKFFDYLLSKGQPVFKHAEGSYVRKTDRKKTVGGVVPGTAVPWHTEVSIWEVVDPCPTSS
ncbi:hypothetical protein [Pseudomonas sp. Ost2]|uniref:hypothetical protein n=1 Tax=Pseudomonas sp. Ost2 TaxID=2678260 RepID=UPI001BB2F4E9|nr:hypothetical protein [Pseudomonas sp. Ost2]